MQSAHLAVLLDSSLTSIEDYQELSFSKDSHALNQRTSDECYDDIIYRLDEATLQRNTLLTTLKKMEDALAEKLLAKHRIEIEQLSAENAMLRSTLHKHPPRVPESPILSRRQSLYTDTYQQQSALKTSRGKLGKGRNVGSSRVRNAGKENRLHPSQTASKPVTPRPVTPRSVLSHSKVRDCSSFLFSSRQRGSSSRRLYTDCKSRQSLDTSQYDTTGDMLVCSGRGIFVQIVSDMLAQAAQRARQWEGQLEEQIYRGAYMSKPLDGNIPFMSELQGNIRLTHQSIQGLQRVMGDYMTGVKQLNADIGALEELTQKICQVKGRYIEMEFKCTNLPKLQSKFVEKRSLLNRLQKARRDSIEGQERIPSVEMVLKVFNSGLREEESFPGNACQKYSEYLQRIFRGDEGEKSKEKRAALSLEVQKVMEVVRMERLRHGEMVRIYLRRIEKMEGKIAHLKGING